MGKVISISKPDVKKWLTNEVEMKAAWRGDKAAEYPDDMRNASSATALAALAEHLRALPDSHEVFRRLDALCPGENSEPYEASCRLDEMLNRFGFGAEHTPEEGVLDLIRLTREC